MDHQQHPPPVPPQTPSLNSQPPPGFPASMPALHGQTYGFIRQLQDHRQSLQQPQSTSTPHHRLSAQQSWDSGFYSPDIFAGSSRPVQPPLASPAVQHTVFSNVPDPNLIHCLDPARATGNSPRWYSSAQLAHGTGHLHRASSAPPAFRPTFEPTFLSAHQSNASAPAAALSSSFRNPFVPDLQDVPPPSNVVPASGSSNSATSASLSAPGTASDDARLRNYNYLPVLPAFIEKSPEFWFRLIENVFRHTRLDDDSKFVCLLNSLAAHELLISDILCWPDSPDNYVKAKAVILQRLGRTTEDGIRKVLRDERIGRSTPSQLWRRLRDIAPPDVIPDTALRVIWLDKLPKYVEMEISNASPAPVEATLEAADRIFATYTRLGGLRDLLLPDSTSQPPAIGRGRGRGRGRGTSKQDAEVTPGKKPTTTGTQKNVRFVDDMPLRMPPPVSEWCDDEGNTVSVSPPSPESQPVPTHLPLSHQLCHYHYNYGASAKKCRPPCNHPKARRC